ncbi:MAG TPA: TonB-dependent receptor [Thermoanaerobaculia bacterium]|nr:TonB-dependent receptor [Thermoanaerobaculia bacterium]
MTRALYSALVLFLMVPLVPADAQETAQQTQAQQPPKVTEEVTVTARKREETVQEVPISVAAPSEQELRDRGADDLEDVAANVAGFTVQNLGPGQSQVAMRGVSSGQIVRDQPGVKEQVGVYLDESVVSLSLFTPDLDLFDLSRIEVLRGPQGTLFGSGSESGTVRYITNQPRIGTHESVGEFTIESIQGGGIGGALKGAVNAPLGDRAAMRVVGYYTRYGGFMDAVQPDLSINEDVNDGFRAGARVSFLFKPSDALSITPRLVYQKVDTNGWNTRDVYNILGNPFTTTRPKVTLGEHQQYRQIEEPFTDEFLLGDVTLSYDFGGKTLTSITSYTDRDILVVRDATALTASITGGSIGLPPAVYTLDAPLFDATDYKSWTQELRLSGSSGILNWVVGGFYAHQDKQYGQDLPVRGFEAATKIPTRGLRAPTDSLFWSNLEYDFDQYALFGEGTWKVSDRLDLTGGFRYYNFNEDRSQIFDGIFGNDNNGTSLVSQPGSTDASGVAPRFMASFKLSENTRLYGQVAKGFRLGGINDPLNVPLCTPADLATFGGFDTWDDETLWNYEVGTKSRIGGGRGTFNVAGFYMDIENLQATVTAGSCSSRIIFNVPKARSTGAELEFEYAPTDNFDFALSATMSDSKMRSTVASAGVFDGDRMPTVPEEQWAGAATYRWPTGGGMVVYATGVYQHIGDRYTQVGDEHLTGRLNLLSFAPNNIGGPFTQTTFTFEPKLPAYDLLNLRLGILRDRWDIAFFVNNVTDEQALLSLDRERGFRARIGYTVNQPRTFGVSTRVNF